MIDRLRRFIGVDKEGVDYSKWHEVVGGNSVKDKRFLGDKDAIEARELSLIIKRETGWSMERIAEEIDVSSTTFSRVRSGRGGRTYRDELGMSMTDATLERLRGLHGRVVDNQATVVGRVFDRFFPKKSK